MSNLMTNPSQPTPTAQPPADNCPKCGLMFDPANDSVIECPKCGQPGATSCCNPAGKNCLCLACEAALD